MLPRDIFLVRHGHSEGNSALREFRENKKRSYFTPEFLNRHNAHYRLTDKGKEQARVAGDWLKKWLEEKDVPWFDRYFVSTHTRTLETAALLNLHGEQWEADFQLRERETGLWGAIPDKKWQKRHEMSMRPHRNHRFYTPMPDGESIADVCIRLRGFVSRLYRECGNKHESLLSRMVIPFKPCVSFLKIFCPIAMMSLVRKIRMSSRSAIVRLSTIPVLTQTIRIISY